MKPKKKHKAVFSLDSDGRWIGRVEISKRSGANTQGRTIEQVRKPWRYFSTASPRTSSLSRTYSYRPLPAGKWNRLSWPQKKPSEQRRRHALPRDLPRKRSFAPGSACATLAPCSG
jgi:hypothetical protein